MQNTGAFDSLSPDLVINTAERALGRSLESFVTPYNSYINRVYALRDEDGERFVIKFYRPARWSTAAVAEEHLFLADCAEADIPVVSPLVIEDASFRATSATVQDAGLPSTLGTTGEFLFAVYPFKSGRTFDLSTDDDYVRAGSLAGRLHTVSRRRTAASRPVLHPSGQYSALCDELASSASMHPDVRAEFVDLVSSTLQVCEPLFDRASFIRLHGDLHRGNILDRMEGGLLLIDFDDMMTGPAVQDLWLLLPGRIDDSRREMGLILSGYTEWAPFDHASLTLVEPLRFLRIIHYLGWQERQKDDVRFRQHNPDWGTRGFWIRELEDLRDQARAVVQTLESRL
jgi:Ser/Thr protein kinase RdoA (MazF antagonist)